MARCLILIFFAVLCLPRGKEAVNKVDPVEIKVVLKVVPPFVIDSGNETYTGFGIDLLNILQEKLSFNYTLIARDEPVKAISDGDADLSIIPMTKLESRLKPNVNFTAQISDSALTMVVNKIVFPDVNNIDDVIAEEKLSTAFISGTAEYNAFLGAMKENATGEKFTKLFNKKGSFESFVKALLAAENGQTALLMDTVNAAHHVNRNEKCSLKTIADFLDTEGYSLAVRSDFNLRNKIDHEIDELVKSKKMADLMDKYFTGNCVSGGSITAISASLFLFSLLAFYIAN